jgi:hypothetical protein
MDGSAFVDKLGRSLARGDFIICGSKEGNTAIGFAVILNCEGAHIEMHWCTDGWYTDAILLHPERVLKIKESLVPDEFLPVLKERLGEM